MGNSIPQGNVVLLVSVFSLPSEPTGLLFTCGFIVHFLVHTADDRAEGSLRTATVKNPHTSTFLAEESTHHLVVPTRAGSREAIHVLLLPPKTSNQPKRDHPAAETH